jgi:adenylate kinase family enzyme
MKRLMIIGGPGSGKSTAARGIHEITGLPLYHLDRLFWRPGWKPPPWDEWQATMAEIAARDEWIMDGNYSKSFQVRMPRAETILWLDLPRSICMFRVLKRTWLNYGRERADIGPGCPEKLDLDFLSWAWKFRRGHAAKYRVALETYGGHATLCITTSPREVRGFINSLRH